MAGPLPTHAAAPANDLCSTPQLIPPAGPFPYTTPVIDIADATVQPTDPPPGNPDLDGKIAKSVWYRFTPARNGIYTITTCSDAGSSTTVDDTILSVYTSSGGCNGPFVAQAQGDEDCGPNIAQASVNLPLSADTAYYIVVWKYCDDCVDDGFNRLQLVISGSVPPPNDTCATALPLLLNSPVSGTTVGANDTYHLTGSSGFGGLDQIESPAAGRDVVYSFTAPAAGRYSIKALHYNFQQNLVLYTFTNCPAGGTPPIVISNSPAAANRSRVNSAEQIVGLQLGAGERILIAVDDHDPNNDGSTFVLEVTPSISEQEPNNSLATASPLASGIEGSIAQEQDVDFFLLGHYPAGWRAFALVDAEAAASADLDMELRDATGDLVEYDNDNNDVFFGESAPNLAGTPLRGGSAYLMVRHSLLQGHSEPYRLYAVVQPPLENAAPESEPNEEPATASADDRNYFLGTLQGPPPSEDKDVYQFSVAEGDLIFVSLDGDPYRTNSPVNARLELLDASGNPVLLVNDSSASSTTNGVITSPAEGLVFRSAVEGVFFARVTAGGNAAAGAYLLSISRNCLIGAFGLNHPPALTNVTIPSPVPAGLPTQVSGTIWELDAGDALDLEIRWGDGATNTLALPEPGRFDFSIAHVYLELNTAHSVTVTVKDRVGTSDSVTGTIQVLPPFLSISPPQNGQVNLQFQGKPHGLYRVDKSDSLRTWTELTTVRADATGAVSVTDPSATVPTRFYRVAGLD